MPKTFPIRLEVEEIALGTVLRKLNDMPGIAKLDLDLGRGGEGAGRERLESAVAAPRGNAAQVIVKTLMEAPRSSKELFAILGGKKSSMYTSTSKLKKDGVIISADGKWQLTGKAQQEIGGALALPAPAPKAAKVKQGPKGRAIPGSGNIVLRELLADGPKAPGELRQQMASKGMSPKSISGVLQRAKDASLIKKNGTGYELTAKGLKIETAPEVVANG